MGGDGRLGSHGNKVDHGRARPDSDRFPKMSIRKVPADSVPYGDSISRNGVTVWAAYDRAGDGETLVAVAATADDARAKYRTWQGRERMSAEGSAQKCPP